MITFNHNLLKGASSEKGWIKYNLTITPTLTWLFSEQEVMFDTGQSMSADNADQGERGSTLRVFNEGLETIV